MNEEEKDKTNELYTNFFGENHKQEVEAYLNSFKPETTYTITPYDWEGETEYNYEIRGYNIYYSKVGFKTYKEAEIEAIEKIKEYKK